MMENKSKMLDLILKIALSEQKIRAVYMNGSRTNSNIPKDKYQDYDIVFVVSDVSSFVSDPTWINQFGKRLIMQEPDKLDVSLGIKKDFSEQYAYLILLEDGNRIDLTLICIEDAMEQYTSDSLTQLLLDKDGTLPSISPPNDKDYWVKAPNREVYLACCNEFWWCLQNVTKGIWRKELPYAKDMFETIIRGELNKMIDWWIGSIHRYQIATGKKGKYYSKLLPADYWDMYQSTYSDSNYENFWESVFSACQLFRTLAKEIAQKNGYIYNIEEDENMMKYITNSSH